jgi:5-formyltetrahydrofolate cyclo-ligase
MPRAIGDGIMLLFSFETFDELIDGKYGVKVPPATNHLVHKSEIDLVIVPSLMFDKRGYRLGRGGGYYDRLLTDMRAKTVGVCLAELMLEVLPKDEHDIAVDYVVAA